ncbi:DUF1254 domain-containing protein [Flavobacterium sp. MC2016-06]|jgi:hypothetical protein|uniref:DUF1254 domain-containing protein n=1 Tax=Flavobacterium sp. MC2016-06 TaxID=2676308 RepID=UPI0012BA6EE1|nr:DUF1254 domain-containing protein [Flavobacterium sp. MC2016-06]MBU3857673.1 DUF1254 domain-containing protein [Flavobacterium sp. MC2016-06]
MKKIVIIGFSILILGACNKKNDNELATKSEESIDSTSSVEVMSFNDRIKYNRAFEAVIWGMPAVNTDLMRQEMLTKTQGKINEVVYWGKVLDWHNQTLTPNPDAIYFMVFFDVKNEPIVLDLPVADSSGSFNGNIVTDWQMPLEDAGLMGVDKGAGGKFLILPPNYTGKVPTGYIVLQSDTYSGYMLFRSNVTSHSDSDVAKSIAYGKKLKVYSLSKAVNPDKTKFTDAKDVLFDSEIKYDASYFKNLDRIIQNEPWLQRDRLMINTLKSIGIEKGKTFNPDAQLNKILNQAVKDAGMHLEKMYDKGWGEFFENKNWRAAGAAEVIKMQATGYADINEYPSDLRGMTYTYGYVGIKRLGIGQFYLISIKDKNGNALDGSKNYKLNVPANVPIEQYWSVTVYNRKTHTLVRNMSRASRSSQIPELVKNDDSSVDIYFGSKAPEGKESNWIPTDSKGNFELMFRLYAPKKEFLKKVWILPDVEEIK